MRKHPSLTEILDDNPGTEWLNVNIKGFSIGDYADAENGVGSISSPHFSLLVGPSESEYASITFGNGVVSVNEITNEEIQNLKGENPLGSINYYDSEYTGISINLNTSLYNNLLNLLTNVEGLSLRVSVPTLEDKSIKCLPLMSYQLIYKHENNNDR